MQTSLLSGVEKTALIWMAERMPSFINSDHLTLVGLLSMLGAGAGYWLSGGNTAWLWVVNGMILLNWAGDSLDGTLARVRNRQRPRYGFYVDHVIDAVSAVLLLGGLALSGYMSATVAVGLLVAFLLLAVESYLATYTLGTFRLSHGLFSPTELRLLLMIGNFALFARTEATILDGRYLLFDVGGVIGVAGMLLLFAWAAIRNTTTLYRQERLP
ncbi:MAG: CDP-alcohol phosphatidyltransferase family protein [Acidobacteria bacterium]|nr:CDP-alcohol phosphatidyltransferase family protein [Acidobacteriota bacterium]